MSKPRPEEVCGVLTGLLAWLRARKLAVVIDRETECSLETPGMGLPREKVAEAIDLLIVVGGDGTLLSGARALAGRDVPVLAVNLGSLGFLTPIALDQLYPMLDNTLAGNFDGDRRRMLQVDLLRTDEQL